MNGPSQWGWTRRHTIVVAVLAMTTSLAVGVAVSGGVAALADGELRADATPTYEPEAASEPPVVIPDTPQPPEETDPRPDGPGPAAVAEPEVAAAPEPVDGVVETSEYVVEQQEEDPVDGEWHLEDDAHYYDGDADLGDWDEWLGQWGEQEFGCHAGAAAWPGWSSHSHDGQSTYF
ncbi:MAG: hypothetical protein ACRDXX_02410 [Stackebrandtia sp.]